MYSELNHYLTPRGYKLSIDDFYGEKNLIRIYKKNQISISFLKKEKQVISIRFINSKKQRYDLTIEVTLRDYNLDFFKKKLKQFKKISKQII